MSDWQTIDTIPKGVRVLGFCPRERYDQAVCIVVRWGAEPNGFATRYPMAAQIKVTHWQRLPSPPEI